MRRTILLTALVAATGAASPDPSGSVFGSPSRYTEQGGAAIYAGVCAACHMADGAGAAGAGRYPSLARDPRLASTDLAIGVVLHGRRAMPGFAGTLTDQQIADVVSYLQTHLGNDYPAGASAQRVAVDRAK